MLLTVSANWMEIYNVLVIKPPPLGTRMVVTWEAAPSPKRCDAALAPAKHCHRGGRLPPKLAAAALYFSSARDRTQALMPPIPMESFPARPGEGAQASEKTKFWWS